MYIKCFWIKVGFESKVEIAFEITLPLKNHDGKINVQQVMHTHYLVNAFLLFKVRRIGVKSFLKNHLFL